MDPDVSTDPDPQRLPRRRRWLRVAAGLLVIYLLGAYLLIPFVWKSYARLRPSFDDNPRLTKTSDGHPGDPLNVALIGTEEGVKHLLHAAGWFPAAALGVKSDLKIAADVVFKRPDDEAPVSSLYLFGRKEDLAFEQPVGDNPRQRHHVRFWKSPHADSAGRTIWIGSASYDEKAGLSHTTGQITHHIAPDIDAERDHLFDNLKATADLEDFYVVPDFQTTREGRNGGGDKWYTDGSLNVGVVQSSTAAATP